MAGPGEVVVDIHAASVNAADYKMRLGGAHYQTGGLKFPHILGRDFSGVVSAVGPGADLKIGDEVVGVTIPGTEGAYAEKIAIKAAIIAKKPAKLSHAEAAAMALTSSTAIWALEHRAAEARRDRADPGRRWRGRRSSPSSCAKHLGATVITTAGARNHDYVKKLGADRVIDYHSEDFTALGRVCDVVFDTVGGDVQVRSYDVLKPGGRLVWIAAAPAGFTPSRSDVRVLRPKVDRDRAHLDRMAELVAAGAVWPPAITRYKLSQAAEAHRVSEGRHLQGKLVLEVR